MFFTTSLLFFTCTWMMSDCTAEDVYALAKKEAKLYFDYNLPWNKVNIDKGGVVLVSIEKTSANVKLKFAGIDGIGVKYIDTTNQVMVTIGNVSSRHNGNITLYDHTSGNFKQWHVHVLERPPANPIIRESSPPWAGQDYQLNCFGNSFGVTKYKWYKGGHQLTPDGKYSVTGNQLTIKNIQPEDSTKLTCVVGITDDIQSNNSDIFSVDVLYGPDNIKIKSEPRDFAIEEGKSITLKCDATCHPPCHFQWSGLVNAKGSSLEVQYMTSNQNGPYTCTATNPKSATKNKNEIVYLNSGKQVTETFKVTEFSRGSLPVYIVLIVVGVVGLIFLLFWSLIWIQLRKIYRLAAERRHSREQCNTDLYLTPIKGERPLPIPTIEEGGMSYSYATENVQSNSGIQLLHETENVGMNDYEIAHVSSNEDRPQLSHDENIVHETPENINEPCHDTSGYLTVLDATETTLSKQNVLQPQFLKRWL